MNSTTTKSVSAGLKPTMEWVTVRDARGREHLEMRWSVPGTARSPLTHAA